MVGRFFASNQKMLSKEVNNFDVFYVQYIERQVTEKEVLSYKKP